MLVPWPRGANEISDTCCCAPLLRGVMGEEAAAVRTAEIFKALADPVRLQLVSIVSSAPNGEACACDLPDSVGRSQPTVSHHLSILVRAGILRREKRGKWAWFRIEEDVLRDLAAALC